LIGAKVHSHSGKSEQADFSATGEHTSAVPTTGEEDPAVVSVGAVVAYVVAREDPTAVKVLPAAVDPAINWHLPT
jgi:hypothetical protein